MNTRRLVLSINDDSTVTIRCDADAFFAHADEIRRLLMGEEENNSRELALPDLALPKTPRTFNEAWSELALSSSESTRRYGPNLSRKGALILAAGHYLTRERGLSGFTCAELQAAVATLPEPEHVQGSQLVYLCRREWLERVRRGVYRLSSRAAERVESLRSVSARPPASARSEPALPSILGLSRFLRAVPTAHKWRRTLLVAYFLQEHCGIEEFDHRLIAACFNRLRGSKAPGSLPSLVSQQLFRRRGLLERGSKRGLYRLTDAAREDLRREPRIAQADLGHRDERVARTG